MPYELALPASLNPWKVKILDNETLYEEPHVTIRFKTKHWRFSLRNKTFLDASPPPREVPDELISEVLAKIDVLSKEWDERFPTTPVAQLEEEE